MFTFLLNDTLQTVSNVDPNTSVLDYLREHLHRTGTKEGCASGDCGACTVVVAEVVNGDLTYKSINACITPVATIHGKQIITVEDLKHQGQLHPVQQSMVDCDGSQCGFCTPGFVMSMFAYRKNNNQPKRESINEALGGNLCRCTGYRPIIDAAVQMYDKPAADQFSEKKQQTIRLLDNIAAQSSSVTLTRDGKQFFSPNNIQQLTQLLKAYPQARLLAGGTDLSLEMTQFLRDINVLIYTGRVTEMKKITESDEGLEIGGAVTYSECAGELINAYPDLRELIERLGSRQIRNQGTLAGNIANASPIGDMPPVLIAQGARLLLRCDDGTRIVPVQDYYLSYKNTVLQPSEFIEKIFIPKPSADYHFRVYKITKRLEDDISAICGAFNIKVVNGVVEDAIIAYGGMAEIPKRATHCEQALLNQAWNETTVAAAMSAMVNDFTPISDFRASADYRLQVSQNLLQRFYLELDSAADQVRVTCYA